MLISELNACFCPNFHIGWTTPGGTLSAASCLAKAGQEDVPSGTVTKRQLQKSAFLLALNAGMCYVIKVNESRDLQNFCPAAAFISSGRLAIFSPMESMQEVAAHGRMN